MLEAIMIGESLIRKLEELLSLSLIIQIHRKRRVMSGLKLVSAHNCDLYFLLSLILIFFIDYNYRRSVHLQKFRPKWV